MKFKDRIALVHTQFGPYHFARARVLIQTYPGTVELVQLASREKLRQWEIEGEFLPITTVADGTLENLDSRFLSQQLIHCLETIAPSILIIAGYAYPAFRTAASWAKKQQIKTILLSDSQEIDQPRNFLKETLKGFWIRQTYDAAFVAGASAAFYLTRLGFPSHKIWRGYDVVDNNYFGSKADMTQETAKQQREGLGLPSHYFLFVGRFASEKNLHRLLQAYHYYCQQIEQPAWSLVMLGSGELEEDLKTTAANLELEQVFWLGFKQIEELPTYYALASALILPSLSEPWGLVVNEAMACGLPILISDRCGSLYDLVFPGINGSIFNPLDPESIASSMIDITEQSENIRHQMGNNSQQIIANYTPQHWAVALNDCIQSLVQSSSTPTK